MEETLLNILVQVIAALIGFKILNEFVIKELYWRGVDTVQVQTASECQEGRFAKIET